MKFELTFLGTGTSGGVPELGCNCNTCTSTNPKDNRLRSSAYIKTKDCSLIIDSSVDVRQQFLREKIKSLDAVLYTHSHADHVLGLDDLRGIYFRQKKHIKIYASKNEMQELTRIFPHIFGKPIQEGGGVLQIEKNQISNEEFYIENLKIQPLKVKHGILDITGFIFDDKLAYITDASFLPDETLEKIKNIDTLILNALRYKEHSTHFNIDQSIEIAKKTGAKRTYFIHMTHDILHEKTQKELPKNVFLAYDGLKLEIQ